MSKREHITVVWLKRDLRLHDNQALYNALQSSNRVLVLYVFEHLLLNDPHYDVRHWNFIKQSLEDMNEELLNYNSKVLAVTGDLFPVFNQLNNHFHVTQVFSHQETGLLVTFNRDKEFKRYCNNNVIHWEENINNGVLRGLLNREDWFEKWESYMYLPQIKFDASPEQFLSIAEIDAISTYFTLTNLTTEKNSNFQYGAEKWHGSMPILFLKSVMKTICFIYPNQKPLEPVVVDYLLILLGEMFLFGRYFKKPNASKKPLNIRGI